MSSEAASDSASATAFITAASEAVVPAQTDTLDAHWIAAARQRVQTAERK